jgi:hypothetical protein
MITPAQIKLAVAAAALVGVGLATWWATSTVYQGKIDSILAKYALAQAEAADLRREVESKRSAVTVASAIEQAEVQTVIVEKIVKVKEEIPIYVQDTSACITYGLVRVLDAAVHGVGPAELPLPAGQSDDSCAPFGAVALARSVVHNYGLAHQNSGELTGLQQWVERQSNVAPARAP